MQVPYNYSTSPPPPVFTHIEPTTCHISIAIIQTVLIIMLTVPTKTCTIPLPRSAQQLLIIYKVPSHEITPTFTSPEVD